MEKEFEESFEGLYNKIYDSCKDRLKEVKDKNNKFLLVVGIVLAVVNIVIYVVPKFRYLIGLSMSISACVLMILMMSGNKNYKRIYKENVIEGLVKAYNEKFYYTPTSGITKVEYGLSNFDNKVDEYYSEDRVFGTLDNGDNFQLAEVVTFEVSKTVDADGKVKENKTQTFRGMYGVVRLEKNTLSNIYIASNSKFRKFSKNRLEVDSSLFEEYYDCITKDKVDTMRIFTSELIEKYIEIVKDNKYGFELKIIDNMMFFRYKTNQLFEPPMFSSGLDKNFIKKNYKVLYYPLEIMKSTIEAVHDVFGE